MRAAAKLESLPHLAGALADGTLSLDAVGPLADVATPQTDSQLAQASVHWSVKQIRELAASHRGATDAAAARRFEHRSLRFNDAQSHHMGRLHPGRLCRGEGSTDRPRVLGRIAEFRKFGQFRRGNSGWTADGRRWENKTGVCDVRSTALRRFHGNVSSSRRCLTGADGLTAPTAPTVPKAPTS